MTVDRETLPIFCVANSAQLVRFARVCCNMRGHTLFFLRLVDFLRRAHVTGVENGQVKIAHTGCSHESPALLEPLARPIWLALEGVARGVSQFIGQNKVWEGDGWVWGEGKSSPPVLWKKCDPPIPSHPALPLRNSRCSRRKHDLHHVRRDY